MARIERMIRPARRGDLAIIQEVERAAGSLFRDVGMAAIADEEPLPLHDLATFQRDGRAWVVSGEGDQPVAYVVIEVVDNAAHIEQVSVHPGHARQGLGRALIDTVDLWAAEHDLAWLTLTTYALVPWNAPYYERLGFSTVANDELGGELRHIREHEAARGLDQWPRVAMRRPVGVSRSSK